MRQDEGGGAPSTRPVLVYDGNCRFCRMWVDRWSEATGNMVETLAQQDPAVPERFPRLDPEALRHSVHRVETDGRVTRGAEAVLRTLAQVPGWGGLARMGLASAPFLAVAEAVYAWVARHRSAFSAATRWLWGASVLRPTWRISRELFLVGLAAVHAIALLSIASQVDGLIGSRGILPASEFMARVGERVNELGIGWDRYRLLPTLGWLGAGDGMLRGLCAAGGLLAVLAGLGWARAPAFFGLWVIQLSLSVLGQEFLSFQWDTLLIEATFLAVFLAPWRFGRKAARVEEPSRLGRGLLVWLLFRLMFESGLVKLASGDEAWRSLKALEFHYWTQPLPGPLAWHAHQWPAGLHRACCAVMFTIELILPWFVLAPRRLRMLAFFGFAALQAGIIATGNYTFFNVLACLLTLLLVDDATWMSWIRRLRGRPPSAKSGQVRFRARSEKWRHRVLVGVAVVSGAVGIGPIVDTLGAGGAWPFRGLDRWLSPLRTFNDFGLFAVMTTTRPEIVVEGSADGTEWKPYEFRHKPGALDRRPGQVAPHQPRLDWQMWFAALGDVRRNPWFVRFGIRLLEGSPEVLGLLQGNPFPGAPPRFIRARLYQYRFTTPDERRATGHWWAREEAGLYCPAFSLNDVATSEAGGAGR